ncbi:NAD(P)-binding protein [Atractiella rhizophila]|nr:NAD(P)-binding protein [Atractiella rhizophila]
MSKTIILTGASRGIGLTTLKLLLEKKCKIVTISRRSKTNELSAIEAGNPENVKVVTGDVSNEGDVEKAVDIAVKAFGKIDGLVLNAGILGPLANIADKETNSLQAWRKVFEINFFSLLPPCAVFVSSGAAVGNTPSWSCYNASKAALNSLCRTLAAEEPDITAVALRPGVVRTEMQAEIRQVEGKGKMTEADYNKFVAYHEDDALLKPEVPAGLLAELVTTADSSLTGQFLNWNSEQLAPYLRK